MRINRAITILYICLSLIIICTICILIERCGPSITTEKVVRVIDGDTIVLESGEVIRMIGIDAPELGELGCLSARVVVERKLMGKEVGIERFGKCSFGRTLAIVWYENQKINLNKELLLRGIVREMRYKGRPIRDGIF